MQTSSPQSQSLVAALKSLKPASLWQLPKWVEQVGRPRSAIGVPMLIMAIALWVIRRFYDGIRHDGMFYAGQTMVRMGDRNIAQDIFFRYGSQDQFTIFSLVNSFLVREFGWVAASMGSVLVSQTAFMVSAVLLLLEFAPLPLVALGVGVCAISPFYGPYDIFSIGEPFTTSRSLAEPMLLFAVLAMLKGRNLISLVLMALASVMHPLLAAPVWCLLYAHAWILYPARRRLLMVLLALVVVIIVIAAIVQPAFFFTFYDDDWWNVVVAHTGQVSMRSWDYRGWALAIFDLGVPLLVARTITGFNQQFLRQVSLVFALGVLITAWGADVFHSVFLTEIQIWRAEALAHVLAAGLFPFLLWQLRRNGITALIGALFVLLGFEFTSNSSSGYAVIAGVVLLGLGNRVPKPTNSMKALVAAFALVAIVAGLYNQLDIIRYYAEHVQNFTLGFLVHNTASSWLVGAAFILGVAMLAARMPRTGVAVSVVVLGAMCLMWDARTPFQRYMENNIGQQSPVASIIPPGKTVLWGDDLRPTWFITDRAAYYSKNQAAGLVFRRATAQSYIEHEALAAPLQSLLLSCAALDSVGTTCTVNAETMHDICPEGGPDYVILSRPAEKLKPIYHWVQPIPGDALPPTTSTLVHRYASSSPLRISRSIRKPTVRELARHCRSAGPATDAIPGGRSGGVCGRFWHLHGAGLERCQSACRGTCRVSRRPVDELSAQHPVRLQTPPHHTQESRVFLLRRDRRVGSWLQRDCDCAVLPVAALLSGVVQADCRSAGIRIQFWRTARRAVLAAYSS